jgi:integrase
VRLGVLPRREAQRRASWLGALAQTGFSQWRCGVNIHTGEEVPCSDVGFPKGDSPEEFLANMLAFLEAAAAKIANPPPWPDFSPDVLRDVASIQEAVLIEKEVSKGEAGNPTVVARADLLRQDVWNRWRAGAGLAPGGEPLSDVLGKLTEVADRQLAILERTSAVPTGRSVTSRDLRPAKPARQSAEQPPANIPPTIETSSAPKFGELEDEYFELRRAGGASESAISTGRMRAATFKELIGDRPIDCYLPIDLQNFVNELQYVPLELSREGENTEELRRMGIHAAIAKNKVESCYEPLALKTIQDGYVQTVRAIINNAVGLHRLRNPFEGYRVRWPDNAKPSVKREALDYEKVDKVFRLGVDSGYLDDAMLGPLCLLSSRRIGILPFIRGSDFDRKHGVDIVRVNGIVYDKEKGMYKRIGYKTEGSLRFFVLHDFFRRIGFVDWATEQGDNFIFRLLASTSDPGDVASKRVNRLLKKAGAIGMNIEVAHSLRHGAKDMFIEEDLDDEATRLQMGHEANDVHGNYGQQSALRRKQCQELAHFDLPKEIEWSMFDNLNFGAMASKQRIVGRPKTVRVG